MCLEKEITSIWAYENDLREKYLAFQISNLADTSISSQRVQVSNVGLNIT